MILSLPAHILRGSGQVSKLTSSGVLNVAAVHNKKFAMQINKADQNILNLEYSLNWITGMSNQSILMAPYFIWKEWTSILSRQQDFNLTDQCDFHLGGITVHMKLITAI